MIKIILKSGGKSAIFFYSINNYLLNTYFVPSDQHMKLTFGCEKSSTEIVNKQTSNKQYNQGDISTMKNINQSKGQRETRVAGNVKEGDI